MPSSEGWSNIRVPTSEQARINGAKGGRKSAENKKAKKTMTEMLASALDIPRTSGKVADFSKLKTQADLQGANLTLAQETVIALIKKARKGDIRAIEMVWELVGDGAPGATLTPLQDLAVAISRYADDDDDDEPEPEKEDGK